MPAPRQTARLNFRLTAEHKQAIEAAAAEMGLSVSDFAISTLTRTARSVLREQEVTRVTERDRQRLLKMLEETSSRPNAALRKALRLYREQVR